MQDHRDFKAELKQLMTDRGIPSLAALSVKAEVSIGAVKRFQNGSLASMQVQTVAKLAKAFDLSIDELVTRNSSTDPLKVNSTDLQQDLQAEYDRLLQQFNQQERTLQESFQREALQILEPWLLQWSAAAHAAQANPQLTAVKLLPLLRPIETLLTEWGVSAIGTVGQELDYDATLHQSMTAEVLGSGVTVKIRFVGYQYQGQVLHRAKVAQVVP